MLYILILISRRRSKREKEDDFKTRLKYWDTLTDAAPNDDIQGLSTLLLWNNTFFCQDPLLPLLTQRVFSIRLQSNLAPLIPIKTHLLLCRLSEARIAPHTLSLSPSISLPHTRARARRHASTLFAASESCDSMSVYEGGLWARAQPSQTAGWSDSLGARAPASSAPDAPGMCFGQCRGFRPAATLQHLRSWAWREWQPPSERASQQHRNVLKSAGLRSGSSGRRFLDPSEPHPFICKQASSCSVADSFFKFLNILNLSPLLLGICQGWVGFSGGAPPPSFLLWRASETNFGHGTGDGAREQVELRPSGRLDER